MPVTKAATCLVFVALGAVAILARVARRLLQAIETNPPLRR